MTTNITTINEENAWTKTTRILCQTILSILNTVKAEYVIVLELKAGSIEILRRYLQLAKEIELETGVKTLTTPLPDSWLRAGESITKVLSKVPAIWNDVRGRKPILITEQLQVMSE